MAVGKRITIDLSESAAAEVDRLCEASGQDVSGLFRAAMSILRIKINAEQIGRQLHVVDPSGEHETIVVESTK